MSRLVALLIVSLLPGAPLATGSCLVACGVESTDTCHGRHETLWNRLPGVVAGEGDCAWVIGAPAYVREDRCQPEPPMKAAGNASDPQLAPLTISVDVGPRYKLTGGLRAHRMSRVLRL